MPKKTKSDNKKTKDKELNEKYNSISLNMELTRLSDKDVNKVIKIFDELQTAHDAKNYYIKVSSNTTKLKGKSIKPFDELDGLW